MKEPHASHSAAAGRIRCREAKGELVLHLPACPRRLLKRSGALVVLFAFLVLFFFAWFYILDGFIPVILALGTLELAVFLGALALMAAPYLQSTCILLTKDRAVVKSVLYGKEEIREYTLDEKSRARQWYSPRARTSRDTPDHWNPQGIVIGSGPYNPEVDDIDLSDKTRMRFGEELPRGELDWLEWRINRFLNETGTEAVARSPLQEHVEGLPEEMPPRPKQSLVRIIDDPFESRIVFPNTVENRSFSGIRSALVGLGMLVYPLYVLVPWAGRGDGLRLPEDFWLIILSFVALLAAAELLKGLTRLFGRRKLVITRETISYRTTFLGIGLTLRLPTAEVISVGTPRGGRRRAKTKSVATATGSVIRTAEKDLNYSEALKGLSEEEARWVIAEVAGRIDAARSGQLSECDEFARQ